MIQSNYQIKMIQSKFLIILIQSYWLNLVIQCNDPHLRSLDECAECTTHYEPFCHTSWSILSLIMVHSVTHYGPFYHCGPFYHSYMSSVSRIVVHFAIHFGPIYHSLSPFYHSLWTILSLIIVHCDFINTCSSRGGCTSPFCCTLSCPWQRDHRRN